MTGLHPMRARAERFAVLVDKLEAVGADGAADRVDAELMSLVAAMRAVPIVQPRAEFSSGLRTRLVVLAEAEALSVTGTETVAADVDPNRRRTQRLPGSTPHRRPHERRIALALAAVAVVGASSSMAVAAQSAVPGDALYPLKRVIEDAHVHFSVGGDQSKGTILLDSATDRLDEVQTLTADGGGDPDQVTETLDSFTNQLSRGANLLMQDYREHGSAHSIDVLRRFDSETMLTLSGLDGAIPAASQPALLDAARKLFLVDAQAGQLCPTCSASGINEIPATLLASTTEDQTSPDATASPSADPSATTRINDDHHGHRPSTSAHPSTLPTPFASQSATSDPTTLPSTRPSGVVTSNAPTDGPSPVESATDGPQLDPTPTDLPSIDLEVPSDLPSVDVVASDLASAVATSISDLLSGLALLPDSSDTPDP